MEIKLQIKTPHGKAKTTIKYIARFVVGITKIGLKRVEYYGNDDDIIIVEVEGSIKRLLAISKRLSQYDAIMKSVLENPKVVKMAKLSEEDKKELKLLLMEQTKIEIIKNLTAEEIEENNKSMWTNLKERLKKINPF